MGRKIATDNADEATQRRRERQRVNQQRCIEKKRVKVMELEGSLQRVQRALETNLNRFDSLRKQCQEMIKDLHKKKLSDADKSKLLQVQVGMTVTKKTVDQCKERLKAAESRIEMNPEQPPVAPPPNLRKATRSRLPIKDQSVPANR